LAPRDRRHTLGGVARGSLIEELLERARAAHADAQRQNEVARLLVRFVRQFREDRSALAVRCAWCGRIKVGDDFIAPEQFLDGDLPERLKQRATHGICPDCLRRESEAAEDARTR
jgi:hypothetical protein